MKNYSIYPYKNNYALSDNKNVKNEVKNPKLYKNFNPENQAQNYQNIPQRNFKTQLASNFEEMNSFPSNNLKREQRTLENKNKSFPKTNKKINNLNENEDKDEVKKVDVPSNFDYYYHSTNISNQDNNKNNLNNEITQKNNNFYKKNIAYLKSDIENIIKKYRNRSTDPSKINRINPKEISSKNKNQNFSYDNKKRNYDLKGEIDNAFYSKNNSSKNNQIEDIIIQKKDKKDFYFNDCQNINKIKVNINSIKNNNYSNKNQKLTYEIDSKKGCLGCNKNIIANCQSNRSFGDNLIKEPNNIRKLLDGNYCKYELNCLKKKNQELEDEKNKYKNKNEIKQNQLNFLKDKCNDINQENVELKRENEELKRINDKLCAEKANEKKLNEKIKTLFIDNKLLVKKLNEFDLKNNQLNQELNEVKKAKIELENFKNSLNKQINELNNKIKLYNLKIEEKDKKIKDLEKNDKELKEQLNNKNKFEGKDNNIDIINKLTNNLLKIYNLKMSEKIY